MLYAAVLDQKVNLPSYTGMPSMAHSPTSPANSTSAASRESTPEPGWEGKVRFKDMPLCEKYEGKYKFMNVDQADNEISLLSGKVEGLKLSSRSTTASLRSPS